MPAEVIVASTAAKQKYIPQQEVVFLERNKGHQPYNGELPSLFSLGTASTNRLPFARKVSKSSAPSNR